MQQGACISTWPFLINHNDPQCLSQALRRLAGLFSQYLLQLLSVLLVDRRGNAVQPIHSERPMGRLFIRAALWCVHRDRSSTKYAYYAAFRYFC